MDKAEYIQEIQTGNYTHLLELWESVRAFVARAANRRITAYRCENRDRAIDAEDLIQEGFFAVLAAASSFDAAAGMSFLGWLDLHLKKAFNNALGLRQKRAFYDCSHISGSLSQPIGGEDNKTLADLVQDTNNALDAVEHEIWRQQLRRELAGALAALPAVSQRILLARYFQGRTLQQIAETEGVSHQAISDRSVRALRSLRRQDTAERLFAFAQQM